MRPEDASAPSPAASRGSAGLAAPSPLGLFLFTGSCTMIRAVAIATAWKEAFFCLHKLKQNICEKNNPSPSPLLVKSLRCPCNSKSQCKLLLRKSMWGFTAFLQAVFCLGRVAVLEPGPRKAEVSAQGKHHLRTQKDSGKLGVIPRQAALPRAGGQRRV